MATKTCSTCKKFLPLASFGRCGDQEHGRPGCKACNSAASTKSRLNAAARQAAAWLAAAGAGCGLRLSELDLEALAAEAAAGRLPACVAAELALMRLRESGGCAPAGILKLLQDAGKGDWLARKASPFATVLAGVPAPVGTYTTFD